MVVSVVAVMMVLWMAVIVVSVVVALSYIEGARAHQISDRISPKKRSPPPTKYSHERGLAYFFVKTPGSCSRDAENTCLIKSYSSARASLNTWYLGAGVLDYPRVFYWCEGIYKLPLEP